MNVLTTLAEHLFQLAPADVRDRQGAAADEIRKVSSTAFCWYLSPWQHTVEMILYNVFFIMLFLYLWQSNTWRPTFFIRTIINTTQKQRYSTMILSFVDIIIAVLFSVVLGATITFKALTGRMVYLFQPCHISNVLLLTLSIFVVYRHYFRQVTSSEQSVSSSVASPVQQIQSNSTTRLDHLHSLSASADPSSPTSNDSNMESNTTHFAFTANGNGRLSDESDGPTDVATPTSATSPHQNGKSLPQSKTGLRHRREQKTFDHERNDTSNQTPRTRTDKSTVDTKPLAATSSMDILTSQIFGFVLDTWYGSAAALLMPDTRGLLLPFETASFFLQHTLLVFVPFYFILRGHFQISSSITAIMLNWTIFALLHFDVFTPVSIAIAGNINYVIQPPPGFDFLGIYYRPIITIASFGIMLMIRFTLFNTFARIGTAIRGYK